MRASKTGNIVFALLATLMVSSTAFAYPINISWRQLNGQERLPDGDIIQVTELPGGASNDSIEVQLNSQVRWWKGMQSGGVVLCQTQDDQNMSSAHFPAYRVNSDGLQLWKAKTFGIHTQVYHIVDAHDHMRAGNSYIFTWSRD